MKTILIIIVFVFSITTIYSQEKIQYKSKYINAIDYKAISGNIEYKNSSIIFSDKTEDRTILLMPVLIKTENVFFEENLFIFCV